MYIVHCTMDKARTKKKNTILRSTRQSCREHTCVEYILKKKIHIAYEKSRSVLETEKCTLERTRIRLVKCSILIFSTQFLLTVIC